MENFETVNTWKIKSSQEIYQNNWIKLTEHKVINPSGNDGIYGVVSFKNKAIGIIPIDENGNTWLVGQWRFALNEYSWEMPMGGGPIELDVLESAKRELKEETGLTANKWNNIMRIHTSNSVTNEEGFVFLAQELTEGETEFEDTEDLRIKKLPFTEAITMVMDGRITDGITIAGLLKAKIILNI